MCRFYGLSLAEVMIMTLRIFNVMLSEIATITKLEMGDAKTEESLSGEAAFNVAQRMFKRGGRR